MAAVNITEYWDVVMQDPNATGVDAGLAARTAAEYIGYFMDTNNFGSPARINGTGLPAANGTYTLDELPGLSDFVRWDATHLFTTPPPNLPPGKTGYDWTFTYTDVLTIGTPAGFAFCATEIDAGRPVKIDFLYWNPVPTGTQVVDPESGDVIEFCGWGQPESGSQDPDHTEHWNLQQGPTGIGHAVTGVGYYRQLDPDGAGPLPLTDYIVVHDNWANTPVHLAIAWANWNAAIAADVGEATGIVFNDDFNDCDLDGWEVHVASPPADYFQVDPLTYHAAPCGLAMYSQGEGYAYGLSPALALDIAQDYQIDFWFMIPDLNNHWFVVMDDGYVEVVIDYGNELSTWDGTVQLLANLTTGQWYHIRCEVHPSQTNYDVYVDESLTGTANFLTTHSGRLRLGDIHDGSYDHGAAYWDEILVTQSGAGSVAERPPDTAAGWGDGQGRLWLGQNWPNPSRAASVFQYYVPAAGRVHLQVCDLTGAKVATLVDGSEAAGWHRVAWNAAGLPCGVYFGRLQQGGAVQARKMIVAR
jgi:hypothetical protein